MSASLTSDQRETIERQQFQPLPAEQAQWNKQTLDVCTAAKDATQEHPPWMTVYKKSDHVKLKMLHYSSLIELREDWGFLPQFIDDPVLEAYSGCIVRYTNHFYHEAMVKSFQDAKKSFEAKQGKDETLQPPTLPAEPHQKIACISSKDFKAAILNTLVDDDEYEGPDIFEACTLLLQNIGHTPASVLELDYLFAPYFEYDQEHHVLIGLAPKQGFVFIIDSCNNTYPREQMPAQGLLALSLLVRPDGVSWPLYGRWASRNWEIDDSPNCARQGDYHNSGIFTCTNMMCLAFGNRLMCYRQRDLDIGKRHRMSAELLGGGFGTAPFDYRLLDIPGSIGEHRTDYEYKALDEKESGGEYNAPANGSATAKGYGRGGKMPSTRMKLSLTPKEDSRIGSFIPTPEDHWPAQVSIKYHQTAGIVYGEPTEVSDLHLVSKASIINACRMYGVQRYKAWSRGPLVLFRRWFCNEVAGVGSYLRGGLSPMGFKEGLAAKAKVDTAGLKKEKRRRTNLKNLVGQTAQAKKSFAKCSGGKGKGKMKRKSV